MAPVVRSENRNLGTYDPRLNALSRMLLDPSSALGPSAAFSPGDALSSTALPGVALRAPLLANPRAAARTASGSGTNAVAAPNDPPTAAELRRAKKALEKLGYKPGRMDTPRARAELAAFQQAVGLTNEPQGEVSDRTLRSLERTAKRVKKHKPPYLTQGMKGSRVKKLQQRLARLGDFEGTPSGVYDKATSDAVVSFRKRHPDVPQGIKSWGKNAAKGLKTELENMAHDPYRSRVAPSEVRERRDAAALKEARDNGIGKDSPKHVIKHFQRELLRAGYNTNRFDGKWDAHTAAMAKQFERRAGITHEGDPERFGADTWKKLSDLSMETRSAFKPEIMKIGEKSNAVLREERRLKKAGRNPGEVDGIYTKATERAADGIRRHFGIREDRDGIGRTTDKLISKRIKQLNSFQKPIHHELTPISEFGVRDAEGAPANNGARFHAGKDWFAPGNSRVDSPISGKVVEVTPSRGNSGQVFGGVVKVQGKNGRVWVFRHVNPGNVRVGQNVRAGQQIARITPWADGPSHAHIEVWKTLRGGYDFENMIDPMKFLRRFL